MSTLFDEKELRKRQRNIYHNMARKAGSPKVVTRGKRKGEVVVPGIKLPFTFEELWAKGMALIGQSAARCPYCEVIGRPANLITLADCVWDHQVPLARGGTWALDNLVPVCVDCNNSKSKLSFEFFVALMAAIERWHDAMDRAHAITCLKSTGVSQRMRGFHNRPERKGKPLPAYVEPRRLALQEDF